MLKTAFMGNTIMPHKGWKLVATVTGANTVTFTDLAAQGYTEACIFDNGYGSASIPVSAIPSQGITLCWGGFYGGVNGLLHGVEIKPTSIKGKYGRTDSTDVMSQLVFYLYAR